MAVDRSGTVRSNLVLDDASTEIARRKLDHLELATAGQVGSNAAAGWSDVALVPSSLPRCSPDEVDLGATLAGLSLSAPFVIVPMTGGHPDLAELNATLGLVAQRSGIAVGVGSQRAALERPPLAESYAAIRRHAPDAVVMANLGMCQLVDQGAVRALGPTQIVEAVDMVRADVLTIHLNTVQELLQPEGDRHFAGIVEAIGAAVEASPVPVVVKETGAGMDRESAARLVDAGVAGLDVGGAGGTSFAAIEAARSRRSGGSGSRSAQVFADWGIPSAASVLEVRAAGAPVIATGGIRNGLDAARALALGAELVGVGRLAIDAATEGPEALTAVVERLVDELRTAMVLIGVRDLAEMAWRSPVLSGPTLAWATQRGLLGQ
jgi:isopentenyl-diphosphate delta-isomerase